MTVNDTIKRFSPTVKHLLAVLALCCVSATSLAANFPLEIIQPQPNLDTKNRFYKAYPGLEYNVRLAVTGGTLPYTFELQSGPTGMTLNRRGEISWLLPLEAPAPYPVSVKVTDADDNTTAVSWTVTVTKQGFYFIDPVNGKSASQGGSGASENPWKSIADMYEGNTHSVKYVDTYAFSFIYWRNGTHLMDTLVEDDIRVPLVGDRKPQVWLAYPGETPVIDLKNAHIAIYAGGTNAYFDGLEFNINGNSRGMGIQIDAGASHVTFRRNKFYGLTSGFTGGNNAFIFISRTPEAGSYYSIQDNEMHGVNTGYGLLGYSAQKVLIEENVLYNISGHPISPKMDTRNWFIRSNRLYDNPRDSITVQYYAPSGNIEISHNVVEAGGGMVRVNDNLSTTGDPVYLHRNTFLDEVEILGATSGTGPFYVTNNVIVNDSPHADKIQRTKIQQESALIIEENLTGSSADRITDERGSLIEQYRRHIGTRGHEIGNPPLPPPTLSVEL